MISSNLAALDPGSPPGVRTRRRQARRSFHLAAPRTIHRRMPQKPADRAKEKRRLTKRLAAWRAKQAPKPTKDEAQKTETKS